MLEFTQQLLSGPNGPDCKHGSARKATENAYVIRCSTHSQYGAAGLITRADTNAPARFYWYADRTEIISPGAPFGLVTAENFH